MTDYKKYLKTALVGDGKIITYRQLSRELKVHVNVAKEMLHDFHHDLNLRKPSSCHATYILSGLRRTLDGSSWPATSEGAKDVEGDEVMVSSPFELSQASSVGNRNGGGGRGVGGKGKEFVRSIVLVGEERLEEVKASFEVLSAIHVYSIEPSPLSDMLLLADNSLAVMRLDAAETSAQDLARQYGSIMNPHAKRRTGPRIAPPLAATPASAVPKKATAPAPAAAFTEDQKSIFGKKTASATPSTSTSTPAASTTTATAQGKRAQADFFKAFGGAGAKKKENKTNDTSSPAPAAALAKPKAGKPSPPVKRATVSTPQLKKEDSKMDIDELEDSEESEEEIMRPSEDEDEPTPVVEFKLAETSEEEEDPDLSPPSSKKRTTAANAEHAQRKAERSAKLRAMMDDSDDEEVPTPGQQQPTITSPTANPGDDEVPPSGQLPPLSITASTSTPARRRRARRKVNKRTTTRDKDGYLVTRNEMVWESYSEDEPEAPPQVVKRERPVVIAREKKEDDEGEKGKKKAVAKKGAQQGNIMSFFGKK
ncbi:hypothetical protein L211DRAFT_864068 [Terfezia boudieri ATCC MYA-4762]|uniref:DNA polymerase delta subunit 3 n=1 Tax=Terfezia boudieri ATCC MYA-4762 TaxID=1051890 RepID=A0A3N4M2M2_9PEZI|nr:hypothetical protein L211DRAFT_864068 [Terfezia boudieri ATCC MYA-4762]